MGKVNVAFGMIVFNMDYYIEAILESIYAFARQIFIVEGPVKYFVDQGYTTSTDNTVPTIKSFPDPEDKITLIQGQWAEKDEMFNAYADLVHPDIEYVWSIAADEVFKPKDIKLVFKLLPKYDSVGFLPVTFFGGFDHVIARTEWAQDYGRRRIQRWHEGARWKASRVPTVINPQSGKPWSKHKHLSGGVLAAKGALMYHYTYVFDLQVKGKVAYYHDAVAVGRVIPDYYGRVYKPWVSGTKKQRKAIENKFNGVHEWQPKYRGSYRTAPFRGQHPETIAKRLPQLRKRLADERAGEHL